VGETKKFYKSLNKSRKNNLQQLVNCPLLEVEEIGDVMGECPDRLITSIQYFLQGIGLMPSLPMKGCSKASNEQFRHMSMADFDSPKILNYQKKRFSITDERL
jgi:hypothetical protein